MDSVIRNKVRAILPTMDLEIATQRSVQCLLEEDLGIPLDEYKSTITDAVDSYLYEQARLVHQNEGQYENHDTQNGPVNTEEGVQERGQNIDLQADPANPNDSNETRPWKKSRIEELPESTEEENTKPLGFLWCAPISSKRYAGVKTYRGKPMVDVREFYQDAAGCLNPGAKGLTMGSEQWETLKTCMSEINAALGRGDESYYKDLGGSKRAAIGSFQGRTVISLREFYYDGNSGMMAPGKKGIALAKDQWDKLCSLGEQITRELSKTMEHVPTSERQVKPTITQPTLPLSESNLGAATRDPLVGRETSGVEAKVPSSIAAGQDRHGALVSIELAPMRRAEVVRFKRRLVLDIREFYMKDGSMCHGRKGIQLTPDQFQILHGAANEFSSKIAAGDASYEVSLSNRRKATVSKFKGKIFADIREYYEKDGELRPGQKGISLTPDQFEHLRQNLDNIATALASAAAESNH